MMFIWKEQLKETALFLVLSMIITEIGIEGNGIFLSPLY